MSTSVWLILLNARHFQSAWHFNQQTERLFIWGVEDLLFTPHYSQSVFPYIYNVTVQATEGSACGAQSVFPYYLYKVTVRALYF